MRYHPDTPRRSHQPIRGTAPRGSKEPKRDHPMPQAAHRPTGLPTLDQPATNPELRPAPQPTPTSPHHRSPKPPNSSRNPPQPHLSTRTLGRDHNHQLASRYQTWLLHPPTRPLTDLTTIGASKSHFRPGMVLDALVWLSLHGEFRSILHPPVWTACSACLSPLRLYPYRLIVTTGSELSIVTAVGIHDPYSVTRLPVDRIRSASSIIAVVRT